MEIGRESFLVTKDVLRLSDIEARDLRTWAINALVQGTCADPRTAEPA